MLRACYYDFYLKSLTCEPKMRKPSWVYARNTMANIMKKPPRSFAERERVSDNYCEKYHYAE